MMRFLVDVSAGSIVRDHLTSLGHDASAVWDRDQEMEDDEILRWAHAERRIVVTFDKDFGGLVFQQGMAHSGVLLVRLANTAGSRKKSAIGLILQHHAADLPNHFCVYQDGSFRVR